MFRSPYISSLAPNYLFFEINQRLEHFLKSNLTACVISLGIGDTTHPLPEVVADAMSERALEMHQEAGYVGYGSSIGSPVLRKAISEKIYQGALTPHEITISDGIKPDMGRFALLTAGKQKVAIQNPSYPVYLETSILAGNEVTLLPATSENGFFPDWCSLKGPYLLYICSPNNPTGMTATREQLQKVVDHALKEGMIIIFDRAYEAYVTRSDAPRSIFEIPGAKKCAIEFGSFSKSAGFSGLRLGWCAMSQELKYASGESILADWCRMLATTFSGVSILTQTGGMATLSDKGEEAYQKIIEEYLENARLLKEALISRGVKVYGGENTPYLWADFRPLTSWETFDHFLNELQLIVTPGVGFGKAGEGFVRFSALGRREEVLAAIDRIKNHPLTPSTKEKDSS